MSRGASKGGFGNKSSYAVYVRQYNERKAKGHNMVPMFSEVEFNVRQAIERNTQLNAGKKPTNITRNIVDWQDKTKSLRRSAAAVVDAYLEAQNTMPIPARPIQKRGTLINELMKNAGHWMWNTISDEYQKMRSEGIDSKYAKEIISSLYFGSEI